MSPPFTAQASRNLSVIILALGIVTTFCISQYFYVTGQQRWEDQAKADIARISDVFMFWIQLAYEPVLGLSMLMQGSQSVTEDEFLQALQLTHQDDISIKGTAYGFVSTRANFYDVRLSSHDAPLIASGNVLTDHPAFQDTAKLSLHRPTKVSAGPIFADHDGIHKLFLSMPVANETAEGLMLALVDMDALLQDLQRLHVPVGLHVELHAPGLSASGLSAKNSGTDTPTVKNFDKPLPVAGQAWTLRWTMHQNYQGGPTLRLSIIVIGAGVTISLLAALLVNLWLTHKFRATQLDQAFRALQAATDQLIKAEKMASLGSLVAGIAHEMNTPIGNSLTVATALREKSRQFTRTVEEGALKKSLLNEFLGMVDEATELLENNTRRAAQLVGNFKQVAVDQSSERRRDFDLKCAIEEIMWTLQPKIKHTSHSINMDIPAGIHCDSYPGALGQIITNLVSNSIEHGFENQPDGQIHIRAVHEDGIVKLDYTDDGSGISADNLSKVFDPFFTTKLGKGGSGLGLHIIYNLVTGLLCGTIKITSDAGQGVQVEIHFPSHAPAIKENRIANAP